MGIVEFLLSLLFVFLAGLGVGMNIARQRAHSVLKEVYDWMCNAPFDYSNGNVYMGIDEGEVIGWEYHKKLMDRIKTELE